MVDVLSASSVSSCVRASSTEPATPPIKRMRDKFAEAPPLYTEFDPHINRIDFDKPVFRDLPDYPETDEDYEKCQRAADEIGCQILQLPENRRMPYWSDPKYTLTLKSGKTRQMTPLECELHILRELGRDRWGDTLSPEGRPAYLHGLTALKILFPKTDISPPLADVTQLVMSGFSYGRKFTNLIGSMDAGKSSSGARLAYLFMCIDAKHTFTIVANPLIDSADSTIYGDLTELYDELCEAHPIQQNTHAPSIFPHANVEERGRISFLDQGRGKGGWMRLRSLKKGGVLVGSKGRGKDKRMGIGVLIIDEVNRVERLDSFKDLPNVTRQPYFCGITTQNPTGTDDFGGDITEPRKWGSWGVTNHDAVTEDMILWPSSRSGITYRLDALDSVNVRLGKVVYTYLVTPEKVEATKRDYGEHSPEYLSQVRAMFPSSSSIETVISKAKLAGSRYDDEWYSFTEIQGKGMFCDPAHSVDGDDAVLQTFQWGQGVVKNIDGTQHEMSLLEFTDPVTYLRLIDGPKWTEDSEFWTRAIELGLDPSKFSYGAPITYEEQIAIQMAYMARLRGVPARNIGYDFSMRPEMVVAVNQIIGTETEAFNYNIKPLGYHLVSTPENTADVCHDRIAELHKITADALLARQIRGGKYIKKAAQQLAATRIDTQKAKYAVEKKADFKLRHGNRSPNEKDVVLGSLGIARKRGWGPRKQEVASTNPLTRGLSKLLNNSKHRAKVGAELPY